MRVHNVHQRRFQVRPGELGALLDSLGSQEDRLWPRAQWPAMRLDRPLAVGAAGGHAGVRYEVSEYEPGRMVRFRFTRPVGYDGDHRFEVLSTDEGSVLRHAIEMRARGRGILTWALWARPLHDALLEDCLDRAELAMTAVVRAARWSLWVRFLRSVYVVSRRLGRPGNRRRGRSR